MVEVHAVGLGLRAREAVEHVAVVPLEDRPDGLGDERVGREPAGGHVLGHFAAERRVLRDGGSQKIAGGDVLETEASAIRMPWVPLPPPGGASISTLISDATLRLVGHLEPRCAAGHIARGRAAPMIGA